MVEVFKTNVNGKKDAETIIAELDTLYPHCHFNFDLEDCDKILRVESTRPIVFPIPQILKVLNHNGFNCEPLE